MRRPRKKLTSEATPWQVASRRHPIYYGFDEAPLRARRASTLDVVLGRHRSLVNGRVADRRRGYSQLYIGPERRSPHRSRHVQSELREQPRDKESASGHLSRVMRKIGLCDDAFRRRVPSILDFAAWGIAVAAQLLGSRSLTGSGLVVVGLGGAIAHLVFRQAVPWFHPSRYRLGSLDDLISVSLVWLIALPVPLIVNFFVLDRPSDTLSLGILFSLALLIMLSTRLASRLLDARIRQVQDASPSDRPSRLQIQDPAAAEWANWSDAPIVEVDLESIAKAITGRRVLVTGAGGAIGSELCRQLQSFSPAELFMIDRDENALHALQLSIGVSVPWESSSAIVADIRDADWMDQIFGTHKVDAVFHTAALKHLSLLEQYPMEAVKTNVLGTANVLNAAVRHGVKLFVNLSSVAAGSPTSMLGATQLISERLTSRVAHSDDLRFMSIRFGNVFGVSGSVVPTIMSQIENGRPVAVSHPQVSRLFVGLTEVVRLIIQGSAIGRNGEVLTIDRGVKIRVLDLAQQLVERHRPGTPIVFTGLRSGESVNEPMALGEMGEVREHPLIRHLFGTARLDIEDFSGLSDAGRSAIQEALTSLTGEPFFRHKQVKHIS